MTNRPRIVTMKWGTLFTAQEVNVLHRACRANARQAFDFICLTDDGAGLDPDIRVLPLPEIGLAPEEWYLPGVWPKLSLYMADLHGLTGRCLFIDLDMMILRDLDAFLDHPAPFVTINVGRSWYPKAPLAPPEAGTGIFAFDLGQQTQILDAFLRDRAAARRAFRNEQDFAAAHASSMDHWPCGWVISFKRWLRRPVGLDLLLPPKAPPETAKVLAFHGDPRPAALLRGGVNFWDRLPHMGHGRVGWAADYWRRYGGTL